MFKQTESTIQRGILKACTLYKCELFRNNVGVFKIFERGKTRFIRTGLCKGSSDLIGYTKKTITPDMVGETIAVFTAIETKKEDWKESKKFTVTEQGQENFIALVKESGGIAGFANSMQKFINIIER